MILWDVYKTCVFMSIENEQKQINICFESPTVLSSSLKLLLKLLKKMYEKYKYSMTY